MPRPNTIPHKPAPWSRRAESQFVGNEINLKSMRRHSLPLSWGSRIGYLGPFAFYAIFAAIAIGFVAVGLGVSVDSFYRYFIVVAPVCFALYMGFIYGAFWLTDLGKQRLIKCVIESRGQLCPCCMYNLTTRSRDENICPECGKDVPRRECVRLWCKLLRSKFYHR